MTESPLERLAGMLAEAQLKLPVCDYKYIREKYEELLRNPYYRGLALTATNYLERLAGNEVFYARDEIEYVQLHITSAQADINELPFQGIDPARRDLLDKVITCFKEVSEGYAEPRGLARAWDKMKRWWIDD
ncbi:hypothetical protein HY642_03320 [Candidatus Woesearchaeota archaeon]|nr:hypothetical protein [Candidatus Woesearchaeota archaeon]